MLSVNLPGMQLDNPIIPASGTFGFGYEFVDYYDINILGSISTKAITLDSRFGNPQPRIAEVSKGMINSIGLQNPGVDKVIDEELKKLKKVYSKKIIANVSGSEQEDYIKVIKKLNNISMIGAYEINVSCPNVSSGGIAFGTDEGILYTMVKRIKKVSKKPIYVKLSPNVTDIVKVAKTAEKAGADALVLINTLLGMKIDINTKKPVLARKKGGLSGPAIMPVAVRMVYDVYDAVKIPIIGCGGISNAHDVIEFMLAGATAVQIGTHNLIEPYACKKIIQELKMVMSEYNIKNLKEIIGVAHE